MSFADDIRKNYTPKEEKPPLSHSEIVEICAKKLMEEAKKKLMECAKNGYVQTSTTGSIFKKTTKRIEVSYDFKVDGTHLYCGSYEGRFSGVYAAKESELRQVFRVVKMLCDQEGIHVERYCPPRMSSLSHIRFWIDVE